MRPYALMEHSPESLEAEEICRGRLHRKYFDAIGVLNVGAVEAAQVDAARTEPLRQQRAHMRFALPLADDVHNVAALQLS